MIVNSENFNIKQIAESGQCFRMNEIDEDRYGLVAYGRYIELKQLDKETIEICCDVIDFTDIWEEYFDLSYDYADITGELINGSDEFLKKAAEYGKGIRILRQDPFEILISFIISQNKNIPSIKKCIEEISRYYGEYKMGMNKTPYYTFPSPQRLAMAKKEELRELKLGYRDEYVINAAQAVANKRLELHKLKVCGYEIAKTELKCLKGIGDKVANCILLYGLHYIDAFPIDVWIKKVLKDIYNNQFDPSIYRGYAGIIQQYMFYYKRSQK